MRNTPTLIPFSGSTPASEAVAATPGAMPAASRGDHVHPRLSSTTVQNTIANGDGTVTFTRSFSTKPGIAVVGEEAADNGALSWKIKTWVTDGQGQYIGVVIKFYRLQPLPAVIALLTSLINFRVDGGTVGIIPFTCIALQSSS